MPAAHATLATVSALLAGGLIWLGLLFRSRTRPISARALTLIVVTTGLLCRLAFVFLTPTFYAPDEQSHFNYIKYLSEHEAFPVMTGMLGDPGDEWEYHQPPAYYLAAVPVYRAARAAFPAQDATVRAVRCFSVALWLLNVWFGHVLLKRLRLPGEFPGIFIMAMVCLLPTYTFISATINNDNLLATLGGGLLCLMAQRGQTLKHSIALGWLLGVALLTKQSAIVFIPAIVLVSAADCLSGRTKWLAGLWHLGLVLGGALLIYLPWAIRNWQLYHSFTPELLATPLVPWPSILHGLASAAHNLVKTFWAVSGISNDVGYPFPVAGMLLLLLCLAPRQKDWKLAWLSDAWKGATGPVLAAFLFAVVVNVTLALRFGYLFGMGQGRHLFPLLYPIAYLLATRLRTLPAKSLGVHAAGFWMTYAVAFVVFSLCRFP